ncbi:hypothetical protein IPA_09155 [Ignicoccus pacificus DSM 13166]|uniref:Uncharacterized protein n=1 Tax=Ignicoccus pacificus DSM 13166 TaxID=940294 RepID=A0A977PLB5_9CREN|nr:hypothetical protein IPA_09155 [Ignicoccus pacificus DSM 13166]
MVLLIGLVGIALEYFLVIFLPTALILSYLYLASLRAYLEGGSRGFKLAVLLGVILSWLAAMPGPLVFIGAYLTSLFLFSLVWWPNFEHSKTWRGKLEEFLDFIKRPKERFFEGCRTFSGCVLRFTASWPAPATIASTLQGFLAPLVLFATGYAINTNVEIPEFIKEKPYSEKIASAMRIIMTLIAWAYAVMNILKNLLLPHWVLVQEYIIAGETSKLPLTARLLAILFGKTAAYVYGALVVILAVYTAYRIYQLLSRVVGGPHTFTALAPVIGYALAANKLGEPMTSIGYALGMTIALKGIDLSGTGRFLLKLERFVIRLGRALLEYDVPLGPLARLLGVKR